MNRTEFEDLKSYFKVLQNRMAERDEDCAEPKNAVDKGYSLAVGHMNIEIETILHELEMQIFPASDNRVGNIDIEKARKIGKKEAAYAKLKDYEDVGEVSTCRNAVEICRAMIERGIEPENIEAYIAFEDSCVKKGFTIKGLLEAGDKQAPKKPIAHQCVACGNAAIPFEGKYCSNCGQKLDWSDAE